MQLTVESLCNSLARLGLMTADETRQLYKRWAQDKKDGAGDVERFSKWLEVNQYATTYQLGVLSRGHGEQLLLNQYVLVDRIGRGRMAGVFKAVHRLGQTVAVKILPPSKVKEPQAFGRFQRETRLAMRLKHPNIVRAFQTGEARGLHYLVMEYLEGETLEEVLQRRGQLPPAEAARLISQALQGLQHIHEVGMVHRDLSPGNLMLVGGQPGTTLQATVKILDIGMGRALFDEGAAGPGTDLTAAGDVLGAPDYMAPEAARDAHAADIRADIYSLGCVLYHALAGQPPFADKNRVRQLMRHAKEEPRPVSQLNPAVPEGLEQILGWMLAKDPAQRYPTPDRAAQALQVFLAAGSDVRRLEEEPQMRSYLQWLDTEGGTADVELVPIPTPAPVQPVQPVAPARALPPPAEPQRPAPRKVRKPMEEEEEKPRPARRRRDEEEDEDEEPARGGHRPRAREEEDAAASAGGSRSLILIVSIAAGVMGLGLLALALVLLLKR